MDFEVELYLSSIDRIAREIAERDRARRVRELYHSADLLARERRAVEERLHDLTVRERHAAEEAFRAYERSR